MGRIFILPYLGNRSKSDPCSYETFFLRITHTIISQSIANSSLITLYNKKVHRSSCKVPVILFVRF